MRSLAFILAALVTLAWAGMAFACPDAVVYTAAKNREAQLAQEQKVPSDDRGPQS